MLCDFLFTPSCQGYDWNARISAVHSTTSNKALNSLTTNKRMLTIK